MRVYKEAGKHIIKEIVFCCPDMDDAVLFHQFIKIDKRATKHHVFTEGDQQQVNFCPFCGKEVEVIS